MNLLIATSNRGKTRELHALLEKFDFKLMTPKEIGITDVPAETGSTYLENALIKAHYYFEHSRMPVLADDTGLEVDALDGQPGLYSARFASNENASDSERRKLLLNKLNDKPKPWKAQFNCTAVLIDQLGQSHFATGFCTGIIISDERGQNGFGYDPIFFFPELGKTMAELDLAMKNRISHRARAIQALAPDLQNLFNNTH